MTVAVIMTLLIIPTAQAYAQVVNPDWTLNVLVNNVNFRASSIGIYVIGPHGYNDFKSIPNGPNPRTSFTIPEDAGTSGYTFEVCAGTGYLRTILPHCETWYYNGIGPAQVTVTP